MKIKFEIEPEDEFEQKAIVDAVKNKLLIDGIYDEVFRPVIKYGEDEEKIKAYRMVWDAVRDYLEE